MNRKRLSVNLKSIMDINPSLYSWIDKQEEVDWVREIKSDDGLPNLLISIGNKTIAAYKMRGAKIEAFRAAKKMKLYKENVSILIGFGLGYMARAMLDKMEKGHHVIVIEPVGHVLRLGLSNFDFSKEIRNFELIIVEPNPKEIAAAFGILDNSYIVNDWLVTINKYTKLRPDEYGESMKLVLDILNQIMCSIGTIAGGAGAKIADNDIACLPYVIRHRGVAELKDIFKDKPAILVSTGPSLAKNIHQLIDISKENKAVIIAVGQALRILLAYDIKPDFICTVDFGEVNMGHFTGLMNSDVPLVTINRAYAPLLKSWQGPKFIVSTPVPGFEKTAAGILTNKGSLEAGGSVAHLCFTFAQSLGCDPITLIGQDLALSNTSHIPLADASGKIQISENGQIGWKVSDHRCHLHNEKDEVYGMGPVHQVPGYYGKPVITNLGLASFITSFEAMASKCEAKVINATEGGADIRNTEKMMLKEVINQYCKEKIDKTELEKLKTLADDGDDLIEKVIPLLEKDIDNLNEVISQGRKGLASARGLATLMSRNNYKALLNKKNKVFLNKLLKESKSESEVDRINMNIIFFEKLVNQLRKSKLKNIVLLTQKNFVHSENTRIAATKNPLVNVAIYGASRRIWQRKLKVNEKFEHFLTNRKDAMTRLERNKLILNAAVSAAKELKPTYKKTLKLLKKYNKKKDDSLLVDRTPELMDLSDADSYFDADNWAHPLVDAKRCIDKMLLLSNAKPSICNKPFDEVKAIYKKALTMREEAIEKAKKEEYDNWEERKKILEYNRLIKESREAGKNDQDFSKAVEILEEAKELFPDNPEAKWGLATALHHSGRFDESLSMYRELIKESPDNNRYKFEMGQVLLKTGQTKEGLDTLKEAMESTSEFDGALANIGQIYEHAGMNKDALRAYNLYLKKFPADYEVLNMKAVCLSKLKRYGQAIKVLKACLKIKPDFKQAKENLQVLKRRGI